ncbi:MAG: molybdopterin molybdotransferase MoeA [Acidimicrobiales bacterium]|nr:molybdopterin molybdotransferase MoeA [Acidimicrobiales bacterium]
MIPLAEAREHVLARCSPRGPVPVALADAHGCVLAGPVVAPEAVPPWANSAMDGYAVRAADVAGAAHAAPVSLAVVDTVHAGAAATVEVGAGQAVRIMTGAPVPPGADAVVMVERTRGGPHAAAVEVLDAVEAGRNVRAVGSDIAAGTVVLGAGTLLGPAHLGVLASVGVRRPVVIPRPRLGVISTGDELVDDDRPLGPGQIRESNRPMLVALARSFGVDAVDLGTVPDDAEAIEAALVAGAGTCDAIATSGGVSMGDVDLVKVVLDRIAEVRWMQVAIRPAKPFAFGVLDGTPIFGLPGNPVSSMVSLSLLGVPGLRRLAGRADLDLPRVAAVAGADLGRRPDGRTAYLRAVARWHEGRLVATPVTGQASHQLASAADANVLVELPDGDGVAAGDEVVAVVLGLPG